MYSFEIEIVTRFLHDAEKVLQIQGTQYSINSKILLQRMSAICQRILIDAVEFQNDKTTHNRNDKVMQN